MTSPEGLEVGAVRQRHLDLDEHVAVCDRFGSRNILEPQVAGAVEDERLHRGAARGRGEASASPARRPLTERAPPSAPRRSGTTGALPRTAPAAARSAPA